MGEESEEEEDQESEEPTFSIAKVREMKRKIGAYKNTTKHQ